MEVDLLLQEAKESIEAAQNYRSELQQRLHGLNQARKQVPDLWFRLCDDLHPPPPAAPSKHRSYFLFVWRRVRTESLKETPPADVLSRPRGGAESWTST